MAKFYSVGVGAGDGSYITLGALRALEQADIIAVPVKKYGKKPTFAFNHILNNNRIMKKAVLAVYSYCLFMVLISCLIFLFRMAGHSGVKPFNRSSL